MVDAQALGGTPFDILQALERRLREARQDRVAGDADRWSGLGFRLGTQWLLAPQDEVREVLPLPPVTRVPNARAWVLGVANIRGALLTVIDLQGLLGGEPLPAQRAQRLLVLKSSRFPLGMVVDEVVGYRAFQPQDQRRLPVVEEDALAAFELGSFVRDGQAWRVISLYQVAAGEAVRQAGW